MATGWRGQYYRYKDFFLNIVDLYKKRQDLRLFLELILSLTAIIIFVLFALKPTLLTIVSLYNEIKEKKESLSLLNQKNSNLQAANKIYYQNQNLVQYLGTSVFEIPKPDVISRQILGIATKNNVTLLGVSVGQIAIIGKVNISKTSDVKPLPEDALSMPLSISIKGAYSEVSSFIKDLEKLRIPVQIDSIAINSSQNQEESAIVSIITARVPYLGIQQ
ncbi:MAG: type 4a pilus biogenesis protein PilO [Ignavibacteria bacterium]|nr:type 4a pilus biogenesis protein PilO [Ignavibacteria bacterium]